jgi:hypothetical protein
MQQQQHHQPQRISVAHTGGQAVHRFVMYGSSMNILEKINKYTFKN